MMGSTESDEKLAAEQEAREARFGKHHKLNPGTPDEIADQLALMQQVDREPAMPVIAQRVKVSPASLEMAISFWKPIYFSQEKDGRLLNGIEAYELGDEKITPEPNKAPYIAMCNLMALEAIRMMGDDMPFAKTVALLVVGTEREKDIADFWQTSFSPTAFQAEWAWRACLAVMAGEPIATKELLEDYRQQLP